MDNTERDQQIALRYSEGRPASRLATDFKLSIPHIRRIIAEQGAVKGARAKLTDDEKVIDPRYLKMGNRIYAYRFGKLQDVHQVADILGWSVKKLRSIEQGRTAITMLDLFDLAKYMNITLSELTKDL